MKTSLLGNMVIQITIIVFLCLELVNVGMLYFMPGSKIGNGIGVFNAWEESKEYPNIHALVKYLVFWVAGTKLIFICLLIVILITGSDTTKLWSAGVLILSILSFYWRLYPIIKDLDMKNQITPKGYSKTLNIMIASFIGMFLLAFIVTVL